jgi:hypothetical protein
MKALIIIVIVIGMLSSLAYLKGPDLLDSMKKMAEEQMKQTSEDMKLFGERNKSFLQEQIDTQKGFNSEYFSKAFEDQTSTEEWNVVVDEFKGRMGTFLGCKIENQSLQVKSFSSEFSVSVGGAPTDELVLGSDSRGLNGGTKAVVQCLSTYENGTATETYYWGKESEDGEFRIWRLEVTNIASNQSR